MDGSGSGQQPVPAVISTVVNLGVAYKAGRCTGLVRFCSATYDGKIKIV